MPKNRNMGSKSHHAQDAQFDQNVKSLEDEMREQPTRPTVSNKQSTKSSKEKPSNTK